VAAGISAVVVAGCGGGGTERAADARPPAAAAPAVALDACALLTQDEVAAAAGFAVTGVEPEGRSCTWRSSDAGKLVSLVVGAGMPGMASSADMAKWRADQGKGYSGITFIIEPVDGLGAPAIRNEVEGTGLSTVEVAIKDQLLSITTPTLDASKALAAKAMGRLP
jgi:hypothetical protein